MTYRVQDIITPKRGMASDLLLNWADVLESQDTNVLGQDTSVDPVDWLEENYYVDRPRDPVTADILPPGPIILADYQKRVIREALSRESNGLLKYSTILWSEPKKSGKTAIAAGIGMYMGGANSAIHIYCLANDGKQSADRIFTAMARCVDLHIIKSGPLANYHKIWSPPQLRLPNSTIIEAIPCDAAGEAGAEPFLTIWSEMWGYRQAAKERLWTEMTIPPTLYGYAMRWVESYAGYEDESLTLWNLYESGVENGERLWDDLPVYVNHRARQLTFWSEKHRQPWQTPEYYAAEAELLTPNEFNRIHNNRWVSTTTALFDDIILWDKCEDAQVAKLPPIGSDVPLVIGLDASVSGDCTALSVVRRHPEDDYDAQVRRVVICKVHVWKPPTGGQINYTFTLEPKLRYYCENYNVVKVVYDPYQLHKMCTDMRMEGLAPFQEFSQSGRRLKSDKQFFDMVVHRQLFHDGDETLRQHVQNSASTASVNGKSTNMRIMKKIASKPVDATIASAMAIHECLRLVLI